MYILFETVASDDPRLDPKIQIKAYAWHYSIAFINDSDASKLYLDWLGYDEITQDESYCNKFLNTLDGEISVMVNKSNPADLVEPTSYGDNDYEKQIYVLTQTDRNNTVSLMKKIMKLHAQKHCSDEQTKSRLLTGINQLSSLEETQMFFATYFEWECAYTATKDKMQEFATTWTWEVLRPDTQSERVPSIEPDPNKE